MYGRIHKPYVRSLSDFVVANTGSVGMPYDGDPRASYLLVDEGRITVRRVTYNIDREVNELLASGYPP